MPIPESREGCRPLFLDPLGEGTYAMDEDRGIQAVVDIYVQSGQLSKAQADLRTPRIGDFSPLSDCELPRAEEME